MKRCSTYFVVALLIAPMFYGCGCQTPSDRDAGTWESRINITINGSTNSVSVIIDSAGNTLAASSRDDAHSPTQTIDTKPVTSVAWGNAGTSGNLNAAVQAAKALWRTNSTSTATE